MPAGIYFAKCSLILLIELAAAARMRCKWRSYSPLEAAVRQRVAVAELAFLFAILRCILILHTGDTLVLAHENGWGWNIH